MVFGYTDNDAPIINIDGRNFSEIEVTDEKHPLYGHKFKISANQRSLRGQSIRVQYKENVQIFIPSSSTNLHNSPELNHSTKLTLGAVKDIILLFQEVTACQSKNKKFGNKSQMKHKGKS
jgi:hypothetical protein